MILFQNGINLKDVTSEIVKDKETVPQSWEKIKTLSKEIRNKVKTMYGRKNLTLVENILKIHNGQKTKNPRKTENEVKI